MEDSKFRQKHKVGVAGSFFNQLMANNQTVPEVGKGATRLHYSDRDCFEVIEVSKDFKTVKLEALNAEIDPEYLASMKGKDVAGHQNWVLKPTGRFCTVVWRHGAWRFKGKVVRFTKEFSKRIEEEHGQYASYAQHLTDEQRQQVYGGDIRPQHVVEGITEEAWAYSKVNLIFGIKDYYYDWSF